MLQTTQGLPRKPEELTAEWLTAALGATFPGVVVSAVETTEVIWGTATKVRLRVTYGPGGQSGDLPDEICVKGGFDERLKGFDIEGAYVAEARFFGEVAPTLDTPLPRCWYAGIDPDGQQGVVIFDDLIAAGFTFGDPEKPWPADRVAQALELQASWHRQAWGCADGPVINLPVGASDVRRAAAVLLGEAHWDQHFAQPGAPRLPASLQDRERLLRAFHALWQRDEQGPLVITHGDAHVGNTCIDAQGRPTFLDWQTVCRAPALYDVAYFIGGALDVEDRRRHEVDLVRHYLAALRAGGGPELSFDDTWQDYRRYTLHGFLWTVTPPVMQPMTRVRAMAERYATAIDDHGSLEALGVSGQRQHVG